MGKQNRQSRQNVGKIEELNPYDKLEPHKQMAVDMRIHLYKHENISDILKKKLKVKCSPSTVRMWFSIGGECYPAYQYKLAQFREDAKADLERLDEQIKAAMPIALNTMIQKAKQGSINAADNILGYGGVSKVQKIETNDKRPSPLAEWEEIFKRAKKYGRPRKKSRTKTARKL